MQTDLACNRLDLELCELVDDVLGEERRDRLLVDSRGWRNCPFSGGCGGRGLTESGHMFTMGGIDQSNMSWTATSQLLLW
jgi:hypothetical protein